MPLLQPESTYFFSWSSVCLSVRHYYSGKFTCTMSMSRHFGFEYALVMQFTAVAVLRKSQNTDLSIF